MAKLYIGNTAYKVMLGDNSGHIADLPTVVWNQLITNGNIEKSNTLNRYSALVYDTIEPIIGHKYLEIVKVKSSGINITLNCFDDNVSSLVLDDLSNSEYKIFAKIFTCTSPAATGSIRTRLRVINYATTATYVSAKDAMLIDLTLMFGAGNEPTSVAQFEQWFTDNIGSLDNYYPYNKGEEIKVKYLPQYM